ncbi:MAG: bifunctional rhamnulose-1-phosphate aldolase/short-chain dehydrogenase [Alphaproteobacteria bacterium]|nr:bifunctional rhamnulose-1-phosphate aldolase/short-chain dehydrogenase [Alphaproteobacteria bacterium]MBU1516757.1 bifunctional rhamnulose-1-phosphate aldolase/short-chain dehydrogenase [Alphaproteobacteria bacterium]MBU2092451.1 bifunctional rhamnulose-1-phosphate aldolase/short-chain dehydrogenase [Alphaproteobacteria bacterium]MBU2152695.1 bifunctional rhamnulose-1-phosphate aldolase/short-chain dehydrogenase [Alphaproteobacteria bacterium]MBU2305629.1 bifunctional rhamnulose-1-phosphate 
MTVHATSLAMTALPFLVPASRWSADAAAALTPEALLLYRSNLLGSDLTVTNFGGGNTSAKLAETDPLTGETVTVLWVKGSGGDIGSMKVDGFSTLYLDKLLRLETLYRGVAQEDEMVGYLPHCTFNLNPRVASIDTPLHAYLPYAHIDHVHPDAVIALAASAGGEAATREIYGGEVGWLPWKRPGFDLGLRLRDYVAANPGLRGVMLAGHGIICWGDDAQACYKNTIDLIAKAAEHLNARLAKGPAFGGRAVDPLPAEARATAAAELMPRLRGLMTGARAKVGHFSDDAETLEFVGSHDFRRLAQIGTSCPDHFLRTKIAPLALDPAQVREPGYLEAMLDNYRQDYAAYYQRNAGPDDPKMRDANPVVVLLPGVGRFTFAADKTTARLAGEFYANAINVMRGAEAIGGYIGLPESEAFAIEYWALEEAKLQRMPKPKALVGRVALVTGAAGGIGGAVAARLLQDGACVLLLDINGEGLEATRVRMAGQFGHDVVRASTCDVTDEAAVAAAFATVAREFGGLDILVANAGLASSASLEETTLELWRKNYGVLAEGYFLTSRAAFPLMRAQGSGAIVFIGSKNALAATPNASAYASAKAASLHLARCLALEGAADGIRVNVVNPDAVIRGSRIWDGDWRQERADAYGIDAGEELEAFYRNRSMLKQSVLPEDIAEAVYFLASDASAKSTGNIINVDAGNAQAFTR